MFWKDMSNWLKGAVIGGTVGILIGLILLYIEIKEQIYFKFGIDDILVYSILLIIPFIIFSLIGIIFSTGNGIKIFKILISLIITFGTLFFMGIMLFFLIAMILMGGIPADNPSLFKGLTGFIFISVYIIFIGLFFFIRVSKLKYFQEDVYIRSGIIIGYIIYALFSLLFL